MWYLKQRMLVENRFLVSELDETNNDANAVGLLLLCRFGLTLNDNSFEIPNIPDYI